NTSHLSTTCRLFLINHTATTETYPLSLHDALPICTTRLRCEVTRNGGFEGPVSFAFADLPSGVFADPVVLPNGPSSGIMILSARSEEHTSELQSRVDLVCRLLLEKKKNN